MHKLHFLFHNYPSQKGKNKKKFQEMCRATTKKKDARYIKKFNVAILFLRMTSFKWSFSNSTVLPSSSGAVLVRSQIASDKKERRCSCSSKITQRRYKVSRHRTPNFHSPHFTFHPAALPRCNRRGAEPGPRPQPQPESNYTLLNILLKSKCVCWRCGSKQKNKCLIKKFTGKGQVT